MQRRVLIRHLERHGCALLREGGEHSLYWHPPTGKRTAVPRHREIKDLMAQIICRQLGVPEPHKDERKGSHAAGLFISPCGTVALKRIRHLPKGGSIDRL